MIVTCPSCCTHYRPPVVPEPAGDLRARCSRCDVVFPLSPATRPYRLVRPAGEPAAASAGRSPSPAVNQAGRTRLSIGMDDPSLAPKLRHTALDLDGTEPEQTIAYRFSTEEQKDEPGKATALLDSERQPGEPAAIRRAPRLALGNLLFGVMCGALGAAVGFFVSSELQVDFRIWTAAGGVVTLLVAMVWLRWISRRH